MSYLDRLRALQNKNVAPPLPTEPTKGASVGFVGSLPPTLKNIVGASGPVAADPDGQEHGQSVTTVASPDPSKTRGRTVAAPAPERAKAAPAAPAKPATDQDAEPERRRQQALAMLERNPALRLAVVCNSSGDPVKLAVAIRDKGSCEVHIPAARFCPFKLWELVAQHSGSSSLQ